MKNLIFVISFVAFFTIIGYGQTINKISPFGNVEVKYVRDEGDGARFIVTNELNQEPTAENSVPIEKLTAIRMTIASVLWKGENKPVNKSVQLPDDSSTSKVFELRISNKDELVLTNATFSLPKNWESFTYKFEARVDGQSRNTSTTTIPRRGETIFAQELGIKVGDPIWINSDETRRELILPLQSTKGAFAVKATLSGCDTADQTDFVKDSELTYVKLNVSDVTQGERCILKFEPQGIDNATLIAKGSRITSCSDNGASCSWTVIGRSEFKLNPNTTLSMPITSTEQRTVVITTIDKIEELGVKLNGEKLSNALNRDTDTQYTLTLSSEVLSRLTDGAHTLVFDGKSKDKVNLTGKTTFPFVKKTNPSMFGTPTFDFDDSRLKLTYRLTGNVDLRNSNPILQYRNTDGTGAGNAGQFDETTCTNKGEFSECSVNFSVAPPTDNNRIVKTRIPVLLTIYAREVSKAENTPVFMIGFDLLNQIALKDTLIRIKTKWRTDEIDTEAKRSIATEVLGVSEGDTKVQEIFNSFVKENDSKKSKVILKTIIGVGNIALKGVGIPLTIPPNLFDN